MLKQIDIVKFEDQELIIQIPDDLKESSNRLLAKDDTIVGRFWFSSQSKSVEKSGKIELEHGVNIVFTTTILPYSSLKDNKKKFIAEVSYDLDDIHGLVKLTPRTSKFGFGNKEIMLSVLNDLLTNGIKQVA